MNRTYVILALDISSTNIGFASFKNNGQLIISGVRKLPTIKQANKLNKDRSYCLVETKVILKKLIDDVKPDIIVVENYLLKFTQGKSKANIIALLAAYNMFCSYVSYELTGSEPLKISVSHARSFLRKTFQKVLDDAGYDVELVLKTKKDVENFLIDIRYHQDGMSEDEMDAIIIGLSYVTEFCMVPEDNWN